MSLLRLAYGLRHGELVHVSDVDRGLSCKCLCPACAQPLVAKKGATVQHHFAHAAGADCPSAVETALHLAAKSLIERRRELVLPSVTVHFNGPRAPILLAPEQRYVIERVELERRVGEVVPDVLAYVKGKPLAIEVRVTHPVDERKLARLRQLGLSAVEIDLSKAPRTFLPSEIEPLVIEGGLQKRWVFNAAAAKRREAVIAAAQTFKSVSRSFALHVDGCPLPARVWRGHAYANVVDDCLGCAHAVDVGENMSSVVCDASSRESIHEQPGLFPRDG